MNVKLKKLGFNLLGGKSTLDENFDNLYSDYEAQEKLFSQLNLSVEGFESGYEGTVGSLGRLMENFMKTYDEQESSHEDILKQMKTIHSEIKNYEEKVTEFKKNFDKNLKGNQSFIQNFKTIKPFLEKREETKLDFDSKLSKTMKLIESSQNSDPKLLIEAKQKLTNATENYSKASLEAKTKLAEVLDICSATADPYFLFLLNETQTLLDNFADSLKKILDCTRTFENITPNIEKKFRIKKAEIIENIPEKDFIISCDPTVFLTYQSPSNNSNSTVKSTPNENDSNLKEETEERGPNPSPNVINSSHLRTNSVPVLPKNNNNNLKKPLIQQQDSPEKIERNEPKEENEIKNDPPKFDRSKLRPVIPKESSPSVNNVVNVNKDNTNTVSRQKMAQNFMNKANNPNKDSGNNNNNSNINGVVLPSLQDKKSQFEKKIQQIQPQTNNINVSPVLNKPRKEIPEGMSKEELDVFVESDWYVKDSFGDIKGPYDWSVFRGLFKAGKIKDSDKVLGAELTDFEPLSSLKNQKLTKALYINQK